jgi:hypothetical protein
MIKPCHIRAGMAALLMVALGACSNTGPTPVVETFRTIGASMGKSAVDTRNAREVLTPAIMDEIRQPYLLVEIPSRQASASRTLFHQRGSIQDWRGADGISIILQDDVLVATRGLGADLLSADPVPPAVLRASRSEAYTRVYRHLDTENRLVTESYRCSTAPGGAAQVDLIARQVATRRIIETCRGANDAQLPVINQYWVGTSDGLMWKSRQWVSQSVEYATFHHLVR